MQPSDMQHFVPVFCLQRHIAVYFKEVVDKLHVQLIILHDQYFARCALACRIVLHHAPLCLPAPTPIRTAWPETEASLRETNARDTAEPLNYFLCNVVGVIMAVH